MPLSLQKSSAGKNRWLHDGKIMAEFYYLLLLWYLLQNSAYIVILWIRYSTIYCTTFMFIYVRNTLDDGQSQLKHLVFYVITWLIYWYTQFNRVLHVYYISIKVLCEDSGHGCEIFTWIHKHWRHTTPTCICCNKWIVDSVPCSLDVTRPTKFVAFGEIF